MDRPDIGRIQNCQQFFFKQAFQFLHILDLFAVGLLAELAQDFLGGRSAQVGADERGLKIVERVAVDFLAEGNHLFNALGQILACTRDCLLHALEQSVFLFFGAAEQGLNHEET